MHTHKSGRTLARARTHTHARARTHTHTHKHKHSHTHTHTHTRIHSHAHIHTHTHTHTHTQARKHARTDANMHGARTHTHTRARAHTATYFVATHCVHAECRHRTRHCPLRARRRRVKAAAQPSSRGRWQRPNGVGFSCVATHTSTTARCSACGRSNGRAVMPQTHA
jgi:hypothetical protein